MSLRNLLCLTLFFAFVSPALADTVNVPVPAQPDDSADEAPPDAAGDAAVDAPQDANDEDQPKPVDKRNVVAPDTTAEVPPAPVTHGINLPPNPGACDRRSITRACLDPKFNDETARTELKLGDFRMSFSGYIRVIGRWIQNDDDVQFIGRNDGFHVENARFRVDSMWQDKIRVVISFDGTSREFDGDGNDTVGEMVPTVRDAHADLILSKYATVRVGRFKPTYDIEENDSTVNRMWVWRAISSRGVRQGEGWFTPGLGIQRDNGIAIRSDNILSSDDVRLGYEVAVQNGNIGLEAYNNDDIPTVNLAMTLGFGDFYFWGAGRYGLRAEGDFPNLKDETLLEASAGARYDTHWMRATVQGLYRRTTFDTVGSPTETAIGAHAAFFFQIPVIDGLWAGYRYGILDMSDLITVDRVQEHTAGVVHNFQSWPLRLIVNYTFPIEQAGRQLMNQRVEALLQIDY